MARNAMSPPLTGQTIVASTNQTIPMIRIKQPSKDLAPTETKKPTPPPRSAAPLLMVPEVRNGRQPRQTSIRPHTIGNGAMKGSPRETVVNLEYSEDPIPSNDYCCGSVKIQKICKIVGFCSFFGFLINLVLYFMGISKLGLNGYLEAFLLFFDFLAVTTLLCGVSKQKSGLLKPYLIYNTIWSLGLTILFLVFMYHMVKGTNDVSRNILDNLQSLRRNEDEYYFKPQHSSTTAILATLLVVTAMTTVIIIDCIFLHIVYRTFQFFAFREEKRREELDKKERI